MATNMSSSSWQEEPKRILLMGLALLFLIYRLGIIVYRLFFSPLAKFPGSKLAAATGLYEFYFDFIKNGKFVFEVERLHRIYGPIVRVNPRELSISDPEFYDKVYVAGSVRRTENYNLYVKGIDFHGSHFLTTPHELHRARRKPLEPYFSRLGINQLEPMIQELAEKVIRKFDVVKGSGTVVRFDHAMLAYTGDIISRICCEEPTSLLDDPRFSPDWYEMIHTIIKSMPLFQGFPWLLSIVRLIPESFLLRADPRSQHFNFWKSMCEQHIQQVKREKEQGLISGDKLKGERATLFHHLVTSDLPASELSTPRLVNEAQVLLGAGTVGTARVLDLTCFYILANPQIRHRLGEELREVMADYPWKKPTWAQLEKIPYLQAVTKEGLRLAYGVMRRLPRVSPDAPLQFKQWTIPPEIPVGMSAYMQHTDPTVFPKPYEFIPERWLSDVTPLMNRNFVPFSKGSRSCLGMNLAYTEMTHMIAALFRPGGPGLELYETDASDVTPAHDFVVPLPRVTSKGIRVIVH